MLPNMSSVSADGVALPVPPELGYLIALNAEYSVLICISSSCQHALKPSTIARHLRDRHKALSDVQKQVDAYIAEFPFEYDHTSVPLPCNGSSPQPIIPIVDGFACRDCLYKSVNRRVTRQHANKAHHKKRVADKDIFQVARLQSWFREKRERYWSVDESQQVAEEQQARRAAIQDVGEEAASDSEPNADSSSDGEHSQDEIDDQIVREIENWKAEAQERRLRALNNVPAVEMDSWLQYTK
jgi:hypothetical protein